MFIASPSANPRPPASARSEPRRRLTEAPGIARGVRLDAGYLVATRDEGCTGPTSVWAPSDTTRVGDRLRAICPRVLVSIRQTLPVATRSRRGSDEALSSGVVPGHGDRP